MDNCVRHSVPPIEDHNELFLEEQRRKTTMDMCEADFFITSTAAQVNKKEDSPVDSPKKQSFVDKKIVVNSSGPSKRDNNKKNPRKNSSADLQHILMTPTNIKKPTQYWQIHRFFNKQSPSNNSNQKTFSLGAFIKGKKIHLCLD